MHIVSPVRRAIVVVLDGLRPDAIDHFALPNFRRLAAAGAFTGRAVTVTPSVTAAAMSSLLTGVEPTRHGLTGDRFHVPRPRGRVEPLPMHLTRGGYRTSTFVKSLPRGYRPLGRLLAMMAGVDSATFRGATASEILDAAEAALRTQREGLIVVHWPDPDLAGHAHGWMSDAYGEACRGADAALGRLADIVDAPNDPSTLLVALADHGGGGVNLRDHDGDHPANLTIPVLLLGGTIVPGPIAGPVSILDIAPTIAWALGVDPGATWTGRVLHAAFSLTRAA